VRIFCRSIFYNTGGEWLTQNAGRGLNCVERRKKAPASEGGRYGRMAMALSKGPVPEGFHTVTPYLVVAGVGRLIEFLKEAFEAEETIRAADKDGVINHAAVRIGDSMVEMGEASGEWKAMPAGLHLYVENADETYRRAMQAGAVSLYEPQDMDYGDRESGVTDPSGNSWYIATHKAGSQFVPAGLRRVTAGMSVKGAAEFLEFVVKAFAAEIVFKMAAGGSVGHAKVRIGDSIIECSEAHGEWGPRPVTLHLYVPDVDGMYKNAIAAGAKSLSEPKDQFYGERNGGVVDAWGNHWYIATHTEDLTTEELIARGASQGESVK
jgi:PhnB protein